MEAEELELYARVHDIFGFPDLLDFGRVPGKKGEFYMAMSKIEPCLDILSRGQLHIHDNNPQTLGRISWPVVAGMGVQLLRALQAIHKRGVLACPESKVPKVFAVIIKALESLERPSCHLRYLLSNEASFTAI